MDKLGCSLLVTFVNTEETFQSDLNVDVRVMWRREVRQCQINTETALCLSTLKFTTLKKRQTNTVYYFNNDINNVKQRRNNVIFKVDFHNVVQRRNNVVNMTICKRAKKYFWASKKKDDSLIINTCFWLWWVKKKGKHGLYNIKINVGKYNTWYMKRIWKQKYEFADGKKNWCKE